MNGLARGERVRDASAPLFQKVLIANRGEIAVRIARTLRELAIPSVTVFHAADAKSPHLDACDEAIEIAGDTPLAAYLDVEGIVGAALACGADAVHPGYGFLSENAAFARRIAKAGLTFIGPDADTIALMGDKISAREFAMRNEVPVAPSVASTGALSDFREQARTLGFPLLIKAAAGGGGKGMKIVRSENELTEAAATASREAERYFGDGRIYAESYIDRPRHIEVQVLGDGAGAAIHLFERECSIQRRFQKIIEEAPAPSLPSEIRCRMLDAAVRLARASDYKNAGTIEFILGADGRFFFLEMNTRLQVEHPVTEMITGVDIVRAQIEIAAGLGLPFAQSEIVARGAAIECRVCAEDPDREFLPETGVLRYLSKPEGEGVRFENALRVGEAVTSEFDPMLAKLVAHGHDREKARDRALAALEHLVILGVKTNADYLRRVLADAQFRSGDLHTGFVVDHADALRAPPVDPARLRLALIAAALGAPEIRDQIAGVPEPHATMGYWRN